MSTELRLRIALEIISNDKAMRKLHEKQNIFAKESSLNDIILDVCSKNPAVGVTVIQAVAICLGMSIKASHLQLSDCDFHSYLNNTFHPDENRTADFNTIDILWTMANIPKNFRKWQPNHFCPLIRNNSISSKIDNQLKITDLPVGKQVITNTDGAPLPAFSLVKSLQYSTTSDAFQCIPRNIQGNCRFFALRSNFQPMQEGKRRKFSDDFGPWISTGTTKTIFF